MAEGLRGMRSFLQPVLLLQAEGLNNIRLNDIWAKYGAEVFLETHISGFLNLCY